MKLKVLTASAVAAVGLLGAGAANALTTLSLSIGNAAIAGFPAPYGSVTIDLTSATTANVTFTAGAATGFKYFFIDGGSADVNVNAASWTIGSFVGNGGALSDGGSGNVDGFGVFKQTVNQFDGFGQPSTSIEFTLTDTSGTWASSDNVLTPNPSGHLVGAHIAVCNTTTNPTCNSDIGAVVTGFATGNLPGSPRGGGVPEPATWAMMVLGFGGLGAVLRIQRRRQRALLA
jgi:hypothetical protein